MDFAVKLLQGTRIQGFENVLNNKPPSFPEMPPGKKLIKAAFV